MNVFHYIPISLYIKEKFKVLISNYPDNKNIDDLFNNVQNVFSTKEGTQLRVLLESIDTKITQLVKYASEKGFSKKDSIQEFSNHFIVIGIVLCMVRMKQD